MSPPGGADPAGDPVERFGVCAALTVAAVSLAPMVVVAGGLAVLIDRRGWRRVPALLTGALTSVSLGVVGGLHAYARVFGVATGLAGGHLAGPTIGLAVAFAAACGVACSPS